MSDDYSEGARDAAELMRLAVEVELARGGDVRGRVERLWIEVMCVSDGTIDEEGEQAMFNSNGSKAIKRLHDAEGRAVDVAAGLEQAEAEVERWRQAGSEAQRAVDEARVAVLAAHAVTVAERASARRAEALAAGSTVEDVEMVSMTAGGATRTLERRYVRDRLDVEAAQLEESAASLDRAGESYRSILLGPDPEPDVEPEFRHPDARESWRNDQARKAARRASGVAAQRDQLAAAVAAVLEGRD